MRQIILVPAWSRAHYFENWWTNYQVFFRFENSLEWFWLAYTIKLLFIFHFEDTCRNLGHGHLRENFVPSFLRPTWAYSTGNIGGFVHYIATFPDLAITVGSQELLEELNRVIRLKGHDFLFSYDTTFTLGEFYVSPLVFKHILFENNPLVAALFLIRVRKLKETHDIFFKKLGCLVKLLKGLPIVTETAIVKAIRENTPLVQIGCWRHLRQDVQRWLADTLPIVQWQSYIDDMFRILRTKDLRNCNIPIEEKKESWDLQFRRYFEKKNI